MSHKIQAMARQVTYCADFMQRNKDSNVLKHGRDAVHTIGERKQQREMEIIAHAL